MKSNFTLTPFQQTTLVILRILIGWHILYEGIAKLMMSNWTSATFLRESQWILSGFSEWIISNEGVLRVVDFMNTWGLIFIGLGLMLGMLTRVAAFAGAFLLLLYFLNNPPMIGLEYSLPSEGNYLIVSKTLIEAAALLMLGAFPTGRLFGLDIWLSGFLKTKKNK